MPDAAAVTLRNPEDQLIRASSVAEALRQLASAKNSREAIVITTPGPQAIPSGITAVQVDRAAS